MKLLFCAVHIHLVDICWYLRLPNTHTRRYHDLTYLSTQDSDGVSDRVLNKQGEDINTEV